MPTSPEHSTDPRLGPLSMWYDEPAHQWVEALPLGNGRLGAMVYGGVPDEHIQFNEDTVWTGRPHDYAHPGAAARFPVLRRLMLDQLALERSLPADRRPDPALRRPRQATGLRPGA
jgi:alpha-L-fucosidase 2